jgi:hypothetical protein
LHAAASARTRLAGLELVRNRRRPCPVLQHVPPLLFLVGLCALIVAVSRPQALVSLPSIHNSVILAIDTSGSMRATDVKPNRLDAAQAAARAFVENRQRHTRIGIVSIAGNASVVQSPTDNREDLLKAIERLQLRAAPLGSGIYLSLATLLPDAGIDVERLLSAGPPVPRHWSGDGRRSRTGNRFLRVQTVRSRSCCSPTARATTVRIRWTPRSSLRSTAFASIPLASGARKASRSDSAAGRCACAWTIQY